MDEIRKDELEGDLIVIEKEILPDFREELAWLTSPDYKPEDNPDHEFRDEDIEFLEAEIRENEKRAAYLRKKLGIIQETKDPEIEPPLLHFKDEMVHLLTWFKDSPDRGDPACICSLCGEIIDEDEMPLRAFRESDNAELRLHMDCAKQVIQEFDISQGDLP